ncbi:MAG: bifunctional GTP diphosphokinase/guanosine-3',5'-bis pyrophosphate 3'-pyrophosphohydrolase [Gammaproteobacteria bacterium]
MKIWPFIPLASTRAAKEPSVPSASALRQIDEVCLLAREYLKPAQVTALRRAYEFGARAHEGQRRMSGEPYIEHPLAVARILLGMRMDYETLAAAILHDVIEDTATEKQQISHEFGDEVAKLVDGVSKLTQMEFETYAEAQAENFRKMLMAMTHDIRVILVKLADRLHNMRTLGALPQEKRRLVARETLDIYAPIAQRLGINALRRELEDLGFAALFPNRHRVLSKAIKQSRGNRKELMLQIKNSIERRLRQEDLPAGVAGREKHLYSIYKKMRAKRLPFSEVLDVYACRIVVDTVDAAYRVLGVVHHLFKPVPGRFKDYIAIPKTNGYQSLHTILFGPHGVPIEVQIRTKEMDAVAEHGIAAHWLYKTGDSASNTAQKRAREWLRAILEIQSQAGNSEEFLENVKIDLFPDEIYVFTPKGDILKLPRGATAVDLAYAVHTDIGNRCVAARIDRRLVPLRTALSNGQTVEIITAPGACPSPAWLNVVITAKARANIRHFLKNLQRDEARDLGQRMLNRELQQLGFELNALPRERLDAALKECKIESLDAMLEEIGLGKRMAPIVARYLIPVTAEDSARNAPAAHAAPLAIKGTEGMVVSFPKCCYPIPGDSVLGYVSSGRGIVIHRQSCKNLAEYRNHPEKWIDVEWGADVKGEFPAAIRLEATNERGALATIAAAIAAEGANIEFVGMDEREDRIAALTLTVEVRDRLHLARVMRAVRRLQPVTRVIRMRT